MNDDKPYDLLLSLKDNGGQASVVDLVDMGMTKENTSFYDKDTYKNSESVRERFTKNGEFDEKSFNDYYKAAEMSYERLGVLQEMKEADSLYNKDNNKLNEAWEKITQENAHNFASYDKNDDTVDDRSKKTRDLGFAWGTRPNPRLQTTSLARRLNYQSAPVWSDRELRQMNRVKDFETGEWLDKPTFWTLDTRPIVAAKYEKGEKDEFGVEHEEGEDKYDENGNLYYETLGNRSVYGKELLNRFDVMTEETSPWHSIDFFDSDDINEKSPIQSVLKVAALVGSMYIPYVGPVVTGLSVLMQTASMLASIGKMITGDETSWTLNNVEAWSKQYSRDSKTDKGSKKFYSSENLISMIGEVAAQLKEQKWITEVPLKALGTTELKLAARYATASEEEAKLIFLETTDKLFAERFNKELNAGIDALKAAGRESEIAAFRAATDISLKRIVQNFLSKLIKKNTKFSAPLSKAYMTFLTTQDAYGEALHMGIPREEALMYAIGYTALEAWVLNLEIGERILPELHADRMMMKSMLNKIFNEAKLDLKPQDVVGKLGMLNIINKVQEKGRKAFRSLVPSYESSISDSGQLNFAKILWGNAMGEMLEETSEELIADFSKEALTIYRNMLEEDTINMWEGDDWVSRYLMSALGGFMGGGMNTTLTHLNHGFDSLKRIGRFEGTANDAILAIAQDPDQAKLMEKVLDKMTVASTTRSIEPYENAGAENFKDGSAYKITGDYTKSLDYAVKNALKNLIKYTETSLKADGAYASKDSVLNYLTSDARKSYIETINLSNLRNTKTLNFHLSHFGSLLKDLLRVQSSLDSLYNSKKDSEKLTEVEKQQEQAYLEEKNQILADLRAYQNHSKMYDFAEVALFESNEDISKPFRNEHFLNLGKFAEWRFNKSWDELTEGELLVAKQEYEAYKDMENPESIFACYNIFKKILLDSLKPIQDFLKNPEGEKSTEEFNQILQALTEENKFYSTDLAESYYTNINNQTSSNFQNYQNLKNSLRQGEKPLDSFSEFLDLIRDLVKSNVITRDEAKTFIKDFILNYTDKVRKTGGIEVDAFHFGLNGELLDENDNSYTDNAIIPNNITLDTLLDFNTLTTDQEGYLSGYKHDSFFTVTNLKPTIQQKLYLTLKEATDQLNSLLVFDPGKYAYAEILFNNLKTNSEVDLVLIDSALTSFHQKLKSISFNLMRKFLNSSIIEKDKVQTSLDILHKIHQLILSNGTLSFHDLKLSKNDIDSFKELKNQIALVKALLYAYRNDNGGTRSNLKGYTPLLNNINKSLKLNKPELLEIDSQQANLIIQDFNNYIRMLDNYIDISNINSGHKLKEETAKFVKDTTSIVAFLEDKLSDTALGDPDKLKEICPVTYDLLSKSKLADWDDTADYSVDKETKNKIFLEKVALEKHIYDVIHSEEFYDLDLKGFKPELSNLFDKIFEGVKSLDDLKSLSNIISKNKPSLLFVNYLIRCSAFESSKFYKTYQKYLEANPNLNLAAVYELEIQLHTVMAMLVNLPLVNQFLDKANESFSKKAGTDPSLKQVFGYHNMVLVEGFPGAGKTKAVITLMLQILQSLYPDLILNSFIGHTSYKNAEDLVNHLLTDRNINGLQAKSKELVMKYFYSDYDSYETLGVISNLNSIVQINKEGEKEIVTLDPNIRPNIVECPPVLFLDEFSNYTEVDLRLLERASKELGFIIIGLGDFDQLTATCKIGDYSFTSKAIQFFRGEKISLVARADNGLMGKALKTFLVFDSAHNPFSNYTGFTYYEDVNNSKFAGVKAYNLSSFDEEFNSLLSCMTPDDTLFILSSTEEKRDKYQSYASGNPKIKSLTVQEAQGLEASYIISTDSTYGANKTKENIYTAFSRAKKGAKLAYDGLVSYLVEDPQEELLTDDFIQKNNTDKIEQFAQLADATELKKDDFASFENESDKPEDSEEDDTEDETEETSTSGKSSTSKINKIEFKSKKEAEEYIEENLLNKPSNWIEKKDPKNKIRLNSNNFKIELVKKGFYTINVHRKNKVQNLWEFEEKWEREPIEETYSGGGSMRVEEARPINASKVVSLYYSFNSLPLPPEAADLPNFPERRDHYYGLYSLNPAKFKFETARKVLILLLALYFTRDLSKNINDDVAFKTEVVDLIELATGRKYSPDEISFDTGLLHHINKPASTSSNNALLRLESVEFLGETIDIKLAATNLVLNILVKNDTDPKNVFLESILEFNLASVNNPLTILSKNLNDEPYASFIARFPHWNTKEGFNSLVAGARGKNLTLYKAIEALKNTSKIKNDPKREIYEKQLDYLYCLFKLLADPSFYRSLGNDWTFETIPSVMNREYVQNLTDAAFIPQVQPLLDFLKDSPTASEDRNGVVCHDKVYIAKDEIQIPKGDATLIIPKGASFICYSHNINRKKYSDEFINDLFNPDNRDVSAYLVNTTESTCENYINNLQARMSGRKMTKKDIIGYDATSFFILKYLVNSKHVFDQTLGKLYYDRLKKVFEDFAPDIDAEVLIRDRANYFRSIDGMLNSYFSKNPSDSKKGAKVLQVMLSLTKKSFTESGLAKVTTRARIFERTLHSIFKKEDGSIDKALCKEIDDAIKNGYIPSIHKQSDAGTELTTLSSKGYGRVSVSGSNLSEFSIKGLPERPTINSIDLTNSLVRLMKKNGLMGSAYLPYINNNFGKVTTTSSSTPSTGGSAPGGGRKTRKGKGKRTPVPPTTVTISDLDLDTFKKELNITVSGGDIDSSIETLLKELKNNDSFKDQELKNLDQKELRKRLVETCFYDQNLFIISSDSNIWNLTCYNVPDKIKAPNALMKPADLDSGLIETLYVSDSKGNLIDTYTFHKLSNGQIYYLCSSQKSASKPAFLEKTKLSIDDIKAEDGKRIPGIKILSPYRDLPLTKKVIAEQKKLNIELKTVNGKWGGNAAQKEFLISTDDFQALYKFLEKEYNNNTYTEYTEFEAFFDNDSVLKLNGTLNIIADDYIIDGDVIYLVQSSLSDSKYQVKNLQDDTISDLEISDQLIVTQDCIQFLK